MWCYGLPGRSAPRTVCLRVWLLLSCGAGCTPSHDSQPIPTKLAERPSRSTEIAEPITAVCGREAPAATLDRDTPLPETTVELFQQARLEGHELASRYPEVSDALEVWARIELATGRYRAARRIWECLLADDPTYAYAHHGLGLVAAQEGDDASAVDHQLAALRQLPSLAKAAREAAVGLTKLGGTEEAVALLTEFLDRYPEDVETWVCLGQTQLAARDYAAALEAFQVALEQNEHIAQAYYGLALAYARQDQLDAARDAQRRCRTLRRRQRDAERHSRRRRDDLREHSATIADLLVAAASVYRAQGAVAEMERLLQRTARLDPANIASRVQLASHYMQTGRPAQALPVCRQLVQLAPADPSHQLNLGAVLIQQGRAGEAEPPLREAVRLAPQITEGHYFLAQCLASQAAFAEARGFAERAVQLSGHPAAYSLLAEILVELGQPQAALSALDRALQQEPNNTILLESRARVTVDAP